MTEAWKQWEGKTVDGKFHLRQYLGGSDHSAVYLTEFGEREPQRVAIKLILADPQNAELQLSRWDLAAKLSHPHLMRLFQMGRCQLANTELLYVAMECADEDLSQILPQRPLTPAEAEDMLLPVLDVLSYLHGSGFVHGRLKPANIMAVGNLLKVSSDGLYRVGESIGGPGKSAYDPPEAASKGFSPAADVWSLGMTLVETLTRRLPVWEGTEQEEPVLPEALPEPFLDVARHCLRRDPQHRWTIADIKARLRPTTPVPHEGATVSPKPFTRWRYILPVAVVLLLLAILAVPRRSSRRLQPPPTPSVPSSVPEQPKPPTGGIVQGAVEKQVLPDVPQSARNTIQGTIKVTVRVAVDPSGSVTGATLDFPGPSKYFANLALQAARRWKFRPRKIDGQNIATEWILRFQFERTATRVFPVQAAP
jgi:TonB family protein